MKRSLPVLLVLLAFLFPLVITLVVVARDDSTTTAEPRAIEHPEDAGARDQDDPALQRFYDQRLAWKACGDYDCARLEVPLDYAAPEADSIRLAVLRNPADVPSQRVGDLVVNPGGPGAGGTWYAERDPRYVPFFGEDIYDHFDLIGFDPRGTGTSAPVDCLTDPELDAYLDGDPDPDTPDEVAAYVADQQGFLDGCVERSGGLALHISTHEAARDMDVLRAALGNATLTYLGTSYGTKLGATYADLFPERSGRMVLNAAVNPRLEPREQSLEQARGFEVALTAYVDHCVARDSCPLGDDREEGLRRIRDLLADLDEHPLEVDDRTLTQGSAFYGLIQPLYARTLWSALDTALEQALDGDGSGLLRWADEYTARNDDGTYKDNSSEAILAINCLDDPGSLPVDRVPGEFADFEEASPTFGRVFAWGLTACAGYADRDLPARDWELDAAGADPILVVGTSRDPATPVQWAKALAEQLESGVLITRDGDGHGGYNKGNRCVDDAVEEYLIRGKSLTHDLVC